MIVTHAEVDCDVICNPPVVLGEEGEIICMEVCRRGVEEASASWQPEEKTCFRASKGRGAGRGAGLNEVRSEGVRTGRRTIVRHINPVLARIDSELERIAADDLYDVTE